MASLLIAIADEVVAALNGSGSVGPFSIDFTATRAYVPAKKLEDMADLWVVVVPRNLEKFIAGRDAWQKDYSVDIGVHQKVADTENATVDPLMGLVEEIADYFEGLRVETTPAAVCVEITHTAPYIVAHLKDLRVFASIISLKFRLFQRKG